MGSEQKASFVLVHGAFHGGWCWAPVTRRLCSLGYVVHTPTYTGLGERKHLLDENTDTDVWIEDVVNVIEAEELDRVVLVGHSYGGRVISGVADRIPERIAHLVYLDAGLPAPGRSMADALQPEVWQARLRETVTIRGARCMQPPPPEYFGVFDPAQAAWLRRRLSPMPVKSYESVVPLRNPLANGRPATYAQCVRPRLASVESSAAYARKLGWRFVELDTGHNAMMSAPDEVVRLLVEAAGG